MNSSIMYSSNKDYCDSCFALSVLGGVVLGCVILLGSIMIQDDYFMEKGLEDFNVYAMMNASQNHLMQIIIRKRFIQIILFFMGVYLLPRYCACILWSGGFSLYYGIVVSDLIIKFGFMGLCYGFFCFFPHFLFYLQIFHLGTKWSIDIVKNNERKMKRKKHLLKIFAIIILFSVSLIWEIYFQKKFICYFFQHLVF